MQAPVNSRILGRLSRRDVLRVGSVSLSTGLLPALGIQAAPTAERDHPGQAKSVIFLWMGGGVTHHESLDPKPEAPEEIRGTLSPIATKLPGVHAAVVCRSALCSRRL